PPPHRRIEPGAPPLDRVELVEHAQGRMPFLTGDLIEPMRAQPCADRRDIRFAERLVRPGEGHGVRAPDRQRPRDRDPVLEPGAALDARPGALRGLDRVGVAGHPIPACSAVTVTEPPVLLLVSRHAAIGWVIAPMAPTELAAGPPTA